MTITIEQALELAGAFLGLPDDVTAKPRGHEQKDVPVEIPLAEPTEGPAPAWIVDFGEQPLPTPQGMETVPSMRWVATLGAEDGAFLTARLQSGQKDGDLVNSPLGDDARKGLESHQERYIALITDPPPVSFRAALERIEEDGFASPAHAVIVEGVLVQHGWMENEPRVVWAITLNGLPPWVVSGPKDIEADVPVWQRNHLRHVVDAMTGEVLFATTIPQPEVP